MRRRTVRWVVVVSVALAVVASPAGAGQSDPGDTPGRFDLRAVRFDDRPIPRWTFVTFAPWRIDQVWDAGYLIVQLDTRGDEDVDLMAVVRSDGRRLVATLYRLRADGGQVEIARLTTGKAGRRGAWVAVAMHKLGVGRSRTSYSWSALSTYTSSGCPHTCIDVVPNQGMIEEPLPGASPSPSPSPTASPSPSP